MKKVFFFFFLSIIGNQTEKGPKRYSPPYKEIFAGEDAKQPSSLAELTPYIRFTYGIKKSASNKMAHT